MSGHPWTLIVHGGAKEIPEEQRAAHRSGVLAALAAGRAVLRGGGHATEAVTAAIRVLEDDPTFNAGEGAARRTDGRVQLDAALMDGETLNIGAVAALEGVRHPVLVARRLLDAKQVLLVGDDARTFAAQQGLTMPDGETLALPPSAAASDDTVGAVALDVYGHVAAGTSTGGTEGQPPGRVGDSPQAGSGFYADDALGAIAGSGEGEFMVRVGLARQALEHSRHLSPDQALTLALQGMTERVGGDAGLILVKPDGALGWAHNSPQFAVAWQTHDMSGPQVALEKDRANAEGRMVEQGTHGTP